MKKLFLNFILSASFLCFSSLSYSAVKPSWPKDLSFTVEHTVKDADHEYRKILYIDEEGGALDRNKEDVSRVNRIFSKVLFATRKLTPDFDKYKWGIHVTNGIGDNAYSMAGGGVIISSEFIHDFKMNDQELTFIIAHEVAHIIAQHTNEDASLSIPFLPGVNTKFIDEVEAAMTSSLDDKLQELLKKLHARQELDADLIALDICAELGVKKHDAASLFAKMLVSKHDFPNITSLYEGRSRLNQVNS